MNKETKGITIKWLLLSLGIYGGGIIALIWGNQSLVNVVVWFFSLFGILGFAYDMYLSGDREKRVPYFISKTRYRCNLIIAVLFSCVLVYFGNYVVATVVTISALTGDVLLKKKGDEGRANE